MFVEQLSLVNLESRILGGILLLFCVKCFAVPYSKCFKQAEVEYGIPKEVLIAIAGVESNFNPNALNYNKNGSYDVGVMQVNSYWLGRLSTTELELRQPCKNIMVGAWILADDIKTYGFNWKAIQRYNGSDPGLNYAQKVYNKIKWFNPGLVTAKAIQKKEKPKAHFLFVN